MGPAEDATFAGAKGDIEAKGDFGTMEVRGVGRGAREARARGR